MTSSINTQANTQESRLHNIVTKVNYALGLLTVATLTFANQLMIYCLWAWAISWVVDVFVDKRYLHPVFSWKKAGLYAMGLFYLLMIISLLYTDNFHYAQRQIERRLCFLLVPFMATFGFNSRYRIKQLMLAFVIGAMLSLLYSLCLPFAEYSMKTGERYLFQKSTYDQFVRICMGFKHRSYFGVMQLMALVCLWHLRRDLIRSWGSKHYYAILGCYVLFLILHQVLMRGRTPLLAMFALLVLLVLRLRKKHVKIMSLALLLIIVSLFAVWELHPRFQSIQVEKLASKELSLKEKDKRFGVWTSCFEVLSKDAVWLTGVGTGDLKDALNAQYRADGLDYSDLHAHNTFLNSWVELGLPGLLLSLFIAIWPFVACPKKHRWFMVAVSIPLYMLMLVETFTQPFHGVMLWSMFVMFFSYQYKEDDEEPLRAQSLRYLCYGILAVTAVLWLSFLELERNYDPRKPRSYAQADHYTVVKTLPGQVPAALQRCQGYRIEAGVGTRYNPQKDVCDFISSLYLPDTSYKTFSAWCYVSEDFDGSNVKIQSFRQEGDRQVFVSQEYDLRKKGQWQLLSINVEGMGNYADCSFFIRKNGVQNFDQLQGYVIFALPVFEK